MVLLASESCDATTRQRFEAWRNASPDHEVAFEREQFAWERTERLRALRPAESAEAAMGRHGSGATRLGAPVRAMGRWRLAAIAASLVVAAGLASVLWVRAATEVYATQVGERRSVRLEDGSRLELNTDTRVAVRMTRRTRHLELLHGESLFEVSHDTTRPFIVTLGGNTVRAVGTAFSIRRDANAFRILVTEGVVEARGDAEGRAPAFDVRLAAGSAATYGTEGLASRRISPEDEQRMLSWRTGQIVLAGETLVEAAAEFNRYNTRHLVVTDRDIAGLQLGGLFDANDLDAFVKVLSTTFGVAAEESGNEILLRGAKAASSQ